MVGTQAGQVEDARCVSGRLTFAPYAANGWCNELCKTSLSPARAWARAYNWPCYKGEIARMPPVENQQSPSLRGMGCKSDCGVRVRARS